MSRPLRIEYAGAWYHVMNRGINRQFIYRNIEHKLIFLSLLEELSKKYFLEIHAFCLMDNHYHLLCRTPIPNLGKAMRHLDGLYTRKFNISEGKDGPIFRGRYKAILIEEEHYLLQVSRYIHLNPVAAKICQNPADYLWSSYVHYLQNPRSLRWLKTNTILKYFNNSDINSYKEFISEGIDTELNNFYKNTFLKSILGTEKFTKNILLMLTDKQKIFCQSDIVRFKKLLSIEMIASEVAKYFSVNIKALQTRTQGTENLPRMIAIYLARLYSQETYQKISEYFTQIKPDSVGRIIERFEKYVRDNTALAEHHLNLIQVLNVST